MFFIQKLCKVLILWPLIISSAHEINIQQTEELYSRDFYTVPTTVKTYENDTVLLPCGYKLSYLSVRWLKDEDFLMESPQSEPVFMDRFHLLANGSLEVMNVQAEDTGKYYCEIVTPTGKAVQAHAIEVQYAPRIYTTPSGFIEMPIGAVLEVICEAEGVPQPAVSWTHNNETIIDYLVGNRQIHIVEIKSRNMSGSIECTGQNGVGQAVTDGVELMVLFAPEIQTLRKIYYSKIGGRLQMECFVESAPLAKVRWFHAGKPITYGPYFGRQDNEDQTHHNLTNGLQQRYYSDMKHSLIVKNARESDMGMYECRAENTMGVQSAYMEVTFRPMPCTFKISPEMQSPTAHILVWQTESYSPIIEFKLKFRQVPSDSSFMYSTTTVTTQYAAEWTELTIPSSISIGPIYTTTYTLHGLHPASIYQVVVLARNHYGWSDSSKILRFATGGEVEFPNYSTESDKFEGKDDAIINSFNDDPDDIDDKNQLSNKTIEEITENSISPLNDLKLYATMTLYPNTGCRLSNNNNNDCWWWWASAIVVIIGCKLY
ncbi:limbic system-associated membrane protein [Calliphora vicina]|uniref:limbic system-associated membrane protein n=1 Tax=Calliphora vicina TaxID=7373 RepID=UPI00325B82AF